MTEFDVCVITTVHDYGDDRIYHKQIKSLLNSGYSVVYYSKPTDHTEKIPHFNHEPIDQVSGKLSRILKIFKLFRKLAKLRVGVFHLHDPELVMLGFMLKMNGNKVIFDVHEDYKSSILASSIMGKSVIARVWDWFEKNLARKFDLIVCADGYIARRFYRNKNVVVVGNYPPLSFLNEDPIKKSDGFTLVYAGGVSTARGIDKVLDAMDQAKGNFSFKIIGPVSDRELKSRIESTSYVDYKGKVPWEQVSEMLKGADLGVAMYKPSINFTYCTGEGIVKIFEYLAQGIPVLVSNFPNLQSFIESNDLGIACDPLDSEEILSRISEYMENVDMRQRQAENAILRVKERFHWEVAFQDLLACYADLIGKGTKVKPESNESQPNHVGMTGENKQGG